MGGEKRCQPQKRMERADRGRAKQPALFPDQEGLHKAEHVMSSSFQKPMRGWTWSMHGFEKTKNDWMFGAVQVPEYEDLYRTEVFINSLSWGISLSFIITFNMICLYNYK